MECYLQSWSILALQFEHQFSDESQKQCLGKQSISSDVCVRRLSCFYTPRERSSGGYIGITLSVRLSVQIRVQPIAFLWFDIGLPYLAHGCIIMRRCVAYINDPDTILNFDLKVKFIEFLTCFRVRPITFFRIDIGLPYLAHGCITIRQCVAYIHDPDSMSTFDLKVKFKGFCHVFMYDL